MLPVIIIKQLSYIYNGKNPVHWIDSRSKPFRRIFIYPSGNLTHTPHDSSIDGYYNRWVAPTATDLPIPDTAQSMLAAR